MLGILLVFAGLLFVDLIVFVHIRCSPPQAQLVCDLWDMVEFGPDKKRPPSV